MKIDIQITAKCTRCGEEIDCRNLEPIADIESAIDYLEGFSPGEFEICESCVESDAEVFKV
jgi:hypothetical protein